MGYNITVGKVTYTPTSNGTSRGIMQESNSAAPDERENSFHVLDSDVSTLLAWCPGLGCGDAPFSNWSGSYVGGSPITQHHLEITKGALVSLLSQYPDVSTGENLDAYRLFSLLTFLVWWMEFSLSRYCNDAYLIWG